MEDKFKSTEFFISDNPEEIEKEKKKRQALHSFFPHLLGPEDNTRYVLLGDNKPEPKVNNPFEQPKQESINVKSADSKTKCNTSLPPRGQAAARYWV